MGVHSGKALYNSHKMLIQNKPQDNPMDKEKLY